MAKQRQVQESLSQRRARLGIPESGAELRDWIRYQISRHINPETGRKWSQADIARKTHASEPTVSVVFRGKRDAGWKTIRVRRLTCEILGMDEETVFGNISEEPKDAAENDPN